MKPNHTQVLGALLLAALALLVFFLRYFKVFGS
jgi:hypothetical protein